MPSRTSTNNQFSGLIHRNKSTKFMDNSNFQKIFVPLPALLILQLNTGFVGQQNTVALKKSTVVIYHHRQIK